jgi:hypothetical protein
MNDNVLFVLRLCRCTLLAQLAQSWCLWELRHGVEYSASMHCLGRFDSLESFWALWARLPRPSAIFGDGSALFRKGLVPTVPSGTQYSPDLVDGYAVFVEGVRPEWEDERNKRGGEWCCRKCKLPLRCACFG